jgi:nocardicin N-oxygenase
LTSSEARPYPFPAARGRASDPAFAELRAEQPLSRIRLPYGGEAWLAVRYGDVRFVLSDPRFSRAAAMAEDMPRQVPRQPTQRTITDLDRPEHSRLRRLLAPAFTAEAVEPLRQVVRHHAERLLAGMRRAGGPADLVTGYALPLPAATMAAVFGLSDERLDQFQRLADGLVAVHRLEAIEYAALIDELDAVLAELVAERRRVPSPDILGRLVAARDGDDRLSERELVSLGVTLLAAGYLTTASQLANQVYTLLAEPQLWQRLVAGEAEIDAAVDELLRALPLSDSTGFARVALEDLRIGEVTVRAGEAVFVALHAADQDEAVYRDPETIDLARTGAPHLAFGHGAHRCLGRHLARLELCEALAVLLREAPGLRLAVPAAQVRWLPNSMTRRPLELPVTC